MTRSSWCSPNATRRGEVARLTWFLGGRTASLSQLLPMLQSMGVVVLEERPFTVTRPDGLPVWIYQFRISPHPTIPPASTAAERDATAERFADAVTAIWQGRVEIDRFNELVMRANLTWQQVVLLRAYAKYLRQAGFPYSQSYIESVLNEHPSYRAVAGHACSRRFSTPPVGFAGEPRRASGRRGGRCRHRRAGQPGHRPHPARVRVAGSGHVADQLLCHPTRVRPAAEMCCRSNSTPS